MEHKLLLQVGKNEPVELITTKQCALMLGYSVKHIQLLCDTGKIDSHKIGRDLFVVVDSAKQYTV